MFLSKAGTVCLFQSGKNKLQTHCPRYFKLKIDEIFDIMAASSTRGDKNSEDVDDEDLRSVLPVNPCSSITQLEELEDKLKSKASYDYVVIINIKYCNLRALGHFKI